MTMFIVAGIGFCCGIVATFVVLMVAAEVAETEEQVEQARENDKWF